MVEKLKNYLRGIGSSIAVLPEERDLSVANPAASGDQEAFLRDAAAMRRDFDLVIADEARRAEKAKGE